MNGAMKVSTQYTEPFLARLHTAPRHGVPLAIVRHISTQNAAGCTPELTMRWVCPSSSSRP